MHRNTGNVSPERVPPRMLAPGARVTADVYAYMFLCDFTNFLVVLFGFAAFGVSYYYDNECMNV
ncbi:hypothetical protein JYU34_002356 [Plutella xylostella]|uniref:Uncharacterized protein n=1 Tax=Plutella xylostella TaxID=51655 RepID=A0ABQ7R1Z0_PLUXY|nr:hypothetical protein JYU34_002356 [Plutella xylostella]